MFVTFKPHFCNETAAEKTIETWRNRSGVFICIRQNNETE